MYGVIFLSKPSFEEILNIQRKINIVDIIRDYIPLTKKGKNYFGICPFHDDHNPSMSVSNEKGMYKCFVCGAAHRGGAGGQDHRRTVQRAEKLRNPV